MQQERQSAQQVYRVIMTFEDCIIFKSHLDPQIFIPQASYGTCDMERSLHIVYWPTADIQHHSVDNISHNQRLSHIANGAPGYKVPEGRRGPLPMQYIGNLSKVCGVWIMCTLLFRYEINNDSGTPSSEILSITFLCIEYWLPLNKWPSAVSISTTVIGSL